MPKKNEHMPMSGNEAISHAIRQINPDVMAAFPITPSTEIPQMISSFIANKKMTTEFIAVESEHSAMSATMGAEAAGARAMTATSSAGLALMYELLYGVSSSRLPVVMAVVNRALTGLLNINADHSDSMGARDAGWIQLYSETAQEAYDNMVMAHRIAEKAKLPLMVCQDGFITSHAIDAVKMESDESVKKFIGEYKPEHYLLNDNETMATGPYGNSPYYMETKYAQHVAMKEAIPIIEEVSKEFEAMTGRNYGLVEEYLSQDADYVFVLMSSACGMCKDAIDELRQQGKKVGLIKIRSFRPFPVEKIREVLSGKKGVLVLDRSETLSSHSGPLGIEIRSALYDLKENISVTSKYYGLGGRDIIKENFLLLYNKLENGGGANDEYINLRK